MKKLTTIMAAALATAACSPEKVDPLTSQNGDAAVAAVEAAGIAGDAALLGDAAPGPMPMMGMGGPACDETPDVTIASSCGHDYPATVHLEWTQCPGPVGGNSFGVVDLTQSVAIDPPDCMTATTVTRTQSADFDVTRMSPDNGGVRLDGITSSTIVHSINTPVGTHSGTIDLTEQRLNGAGTAVRTVDTDGTFSVALDATVMPPTRTVDAQLAVVFVGENKSFNVTVTDVVRIPPTECPFPISGTVQVTTSNGGSSATHVLVYGPDCGEATLDGQPFDLPPAHPPAQPPH